MEHCQVLRRELLELLSALARLCSHLYRRVAVISRTPSLIVSDWDKAKTVALGFLPKNFWISKRSLIPFSAVKTSTCNIAFPPFWDLLTAFTAADWKQFSISNLLP